MPSLFKGFAEWLIDSNVDNLLIWYQVLIGSLPDIIKSDELEKEFVKLLPLLIENLGSQKTVVRKSTHRWIASYVKLSLKLELVLSQIINVGLTHNKHRTRQHSMLVIPALLSLKKSWVQERSKPVIQLVETVAHKLGDSSEIVQKTAKKLLVELKRVYPEVIPRIISKVSKKRLRNSCNKILGYELESESEESEEERPIIDRHANRPKSPKESPKKSPKKIIKEPSPERKATITSKPVLPEPKPTISAPKKPTPPSERNDDFEVRRISKQEHSKPFENKKTPKKEMSSELEVTRQREKIAKTPIETEAKAPLPERSAAKSKPFKIRKNNKFENETIDDAQLSNTQKFERNDVMNSASNKNIRKSMQNIALTESERPVHSISVMESQDARSVTQVTTKPTSKPSSKPAPKSISKPPINNSSSQSSLTQKPMKMDLTQTHSEPVKKKIPERKPISLEPEEEKEVPVKTKHFTIEKESETSSEESGEDEGEEEEEEDEQEQDSDEEEFPVALNGLVFSFLPQETAEGLNDAADGKHRTFAIEKCEKLIKKQLSNPNEDFPIYITDIAKKMCKMMHDSNFKTSLTALRIIHSLATKYPRDMVNWLSYLVTNLSNKLSDNKIVIRHAVLKVFYTLVTSLGSEKIVPLVFPFLQNDNWHIREEILSILIMSFIISGTTWGLSDPKSLDQICKMVNDEKQKVSTAAFETLCMILSKDSSTAIILNSYLDNTVYNSISERCLSGILSTINYDGIVEFPSQQQPVTQPNPMVYQTQYSTDQDLKSVSDISEPRKQFGNHPQNQAIDFNKTNSTTQSIGNKMWLPGFNMTASSIKSEQSVRISQDPYSQTPVQYQRKEKVDNRSNRGINNHLEKKAANYTPEVHQSKPRTFGNSNPSMTTHSMNAPPSHTNSVHKQPTDSTRSNTFYSRGDNAGLSYKNNPNISDKLKIL